MTQTESTLKISYFLKANQLSSTLLLKEWEKSKRENPCAQNHTILGYSYKLLGVLFWNMPKLLVPWTSWKRSWDLESQGSLKREPLQAVRVYWAGFYSLQAVRAISGHQKSSAWLTQWSTASIMRTLNIPSVAFPYSPVFQGHWFCKFWKNASR